MSALLSFPQQKEDLAGEGLFLAIRVEDQALVKDLQSLSPRIMQWDESTFLLDLCPCMTFWQYQARRRQQTLLDLLKAELALIFADSPYHAGFGERPWQALLLLRLLEEKEIPALPHSRFAQNLLRSMPWDIWWETAERYVQHKADRSKKDLSFFQQQKRGMQVTMRRLGIKEPAQLTSMPVAQIQRRFGSLMAEIWEQTLSLTDKSAFPWTSLVFCENPRIQRHLDFGTVDWSTVEAYLTEDLNRLCVLDSFKKGERILQLEWMIVLCNLQTIPVSIFFRHPHSLHEESPHQRTALLQISYSFQKLLQKIQNQDEPSPIISWTLEVKEKVQTRLRQPTLFQESADDWNALMNLENMLLKPLEAYQLMEDWVPEDSFAKNSGNPSSSAFSLNSPSLRSFLQLGLLRPLFLYLKPQRLLPEGSKALWNFRERTMDKWWRTENQTFTRDYFQFTRDAEMLWVFRDPSGDCFAHGIYG